MKNTKIEWVSTVSADGTVVPGHTASPWYGCSHVHVGCHNCYAEMLAKRNPKTLGVWGDGGTRVKSKSFVGALLKFNEQAEAAGQIVSVFPSLCDPFEDRPELEPWRQEMFAVIDSCPWVRLLLLTKRPENVRRMWSAAGHRPNVWLIASISDQPTADKLVPDLLACAGLVPVLGLSAEPLLGPVNLTRHLGFWMKEPCPDHKGRFSLECAACNGKNAVRVNRIQWLICGGESGPGARRFELDWARSLQSQCYKADVPYFFKQAGSNPWDWDRGDPLAYVPSELAPLKLKDGKGGSLEELPHELQCRDFPRTT